MTEDTIIHASRRSVLKVLGGSLLAASPAAGLFAAAANQSFALWHQVQDVVVADLTRLYLLTVKNYSVHNKRFKNFTEHVDGVRGSFAGAYLEG